MKAHDFAKYLLTQKNSEIVFDSNLSPKLYSLRCFDNNENKHFQSWEFSDYLEYCDTLASIFNEYNGEKITGCYFQSVVVFSGGFELSVWEKRYD